MGPYKSEISELITSKWYAQKKKIGRLFSSWQVFKDSSRFFILYLVVLLICLFYKSVSERFRALRTDINTKNFFSQIVTITFSFFKISVKLNDKVFDCICLSDAQWYSEMFVSSKQRFENCPHPQPHTSPIKTWILQTEKLCPQTRSGYSSFLLLL